MWYHLILSDITYNQDDITLKLDDIILRRGDITLNRGDITSKARWYHILLINSKTTPHKRQDMGLWGYRVLMFALNSTEAILCHVRVVCFNNLMGTRCIFRSYEIGSRSYETAWHELAPVKFRYILHQNSSFCLINY